MDAKTKRAARVHRHVRVRKKVAGTAERPRLAVYRSNRHIYAQLIDDDAARTVASASDRELKADDAKGGAKADAKGGAKESGKDKGQEKKKTDAAKAVGGLLAERAKAAGVEVVVFDRGGRLFHGRVAALAEGAREKGLQI